MGDSFITSAWGGEWLQSIIVQYKTLVLNWRLYAFANGGRGVKILENVYVNVPLTRQTDGFIDGRGKLRMFLCLTQAAKPARILFVPTANYKVSHLLANLGWVALDLGCSAILL